MIFFQHIAAFLPQLRHGLCATDTADHKSRMDYLIVSHFTSFAKITMLQFSVPAYIVRLHERILPALEQLLLALPAQYAEQGLCNCRASVCLSHPAAARCCCCRFAAVGPAGRRYRSLAAAANTSSNTLSAYVYWMKTYFFW